ncbi:MAG: hypothetical protein PXY39_11155, partial [archaeon]|nr:hypothetical protein [archaeon]
MEENLRTVNDFFTWLGTESDSAVTNRGIYWSGNMKEFVNYLLNSRKLSTTTIASRISVIRKFLRANKVEYTDDVTVPRTVRSEQDRLPTKRELRKILSNAETREKALILFSISGGLKRCYLRLLRFRNIDLEKEFPSVIVDWQDFSKNRIPDG